jgi:hypothetical protein
VLLTRLTDECAPLLGDDTSATMMQDCCEILAEMNGEELRCFCKEDVLERLGTQLRPCDPPGSIPLRTRARDLFGRVVRASG